MKKLLILVILFTSCAKEEPLVPLCDWIQTTYDGKTLRLKVYSESPSITMYRDFGTRIGEFTIVKHYYQCISITATHGEKFTFEDNGDICQITVR